MNADDARRIVKQALGQVVPESDLDRLSGDEPLRDALELDSLDFLSFVEQLSDLSGQRIDETDYPSLGTLDSAVHLLVGAVAAPG